MSAMVSQTTGISIVCPTICSGAAQRKQQKYVSPAFVRGIDGVDSPHKGSQRAINAENISIWWRRHGST